MMDYTGIEELVTVLFNDVSDKGGNPYIEHCISVAEPVRDVFGWKAYSVGLLHDVIEDTHVTKMNLLKLGVPYSIVEAVVILTRLKDESYDDYLNRVLRSGNEMALAVKLSDSYNNLDETRLNGKSLSPSHKKRYQNNIELVGGALSQIEPVKCMKLIDILYEKNINK